MENPQRTVPTGFIGTPAAQALGLILGFAAAIGMMISGIYRITCMYAFVGVVMFIIPKLFGVKNVVMLIALGVAFFLISTFVGALAFTVPEIEDHDESTISGDFNNVTITENGDTYDISVTYVGSVSGEMKLIYGPIASANFRFIDYARNDPLTLTGSGNIYTATGVELNSEKPTCMYFEMENDDESDKSNQFIYSQNLSSGEIKKAAIIANMYFTGIITTMFLLIVLLTAWMRRSLEKTRAKMEAEGRLYPQGYGRCKECGMIVLPGETVCRKCGAYIDIPDEIKEKMKHKVEYIECSECGAEVPADARRCPKCGASFDEETEEVHVQVTEEELKTEVQARAAAEAESEGEYFECSECGAKVPADANKCPKCGAEFDEDEE